MANNNGLNCLSVKEAVNAMVGVAWNERTFLDISSQELAGKVIGQYQTGFHFYSESDVHMLVQAVDLSSPISVVNIVSGIGAKARYVTSIAHGLTTGNVVALWGFADDRYNVISQITTVGVASQFELQIDVDYDAGDQGYMKVLTAGQYASTENSIIAPEETLIHCGLDYDNQDNSNMRHIVTFIQRNSVASKVIRMTEV